MTNSTRNDEHQTGAADVACDGLCDTTANSAAARDLPSEDTPEPSLQPDNPTGQSRDARGRFARGNPSRLIHGLTSQADKANQLPAALAFARAQIDAYVAGMIADRGGADAVISTIERGLMEDNARLHRKILQLEAAFEFHGMFDKQGKLRVAWLKTLINLIATKTRLDLALGLDRKSRDVTNLSPAEWAAATTDQRTTPTQETDR